MMPRFDELLQELSKIFHLSLHTDKSHACSIQFHHQLTLQLQLDLAQENMLLFSKLVEIPPGKFRENVLREALKANAGSDPRIGIFGYFSHTNHLILYQRYPLEILNGERLAGLIGAFLEYGESWREAVEKGQSAPLTSKASPFGPKP